jgi:serine protease AprX
LEVNKASHPAGVYDSKGRFTRDEKKRAKDVLMKRTTFPALLVILGLILYNLAVARGHTASADPPPLTKASPWVMEATADGEQSDFLVILHQQADLSTAYTLPTKGARGRYVYATLREKALQAQAPLRAWLDARGVPYRAYYIVNLIHVLSGDRVLVEALAARRDVARIEANPRVQNITRPPATASALLAPQAVEWNIARVGAPGVWALGYTGQGVVVGGQDTGYDWDHPALINQYRGWDGASANHDYNWHDAIHSGGGSCGADSLTPCDDYGHGTHTMGTAVGDDGGTNQIGMAPGARWIGCRNMNQGVGTPATYLECFEFFLAPYPPGGDPFTDGRPDLAHDVTVNSWTCPPSEGCAWNDLQAAVQAQRAAGIMTVVSAGNSGPSCSSVEDPPALYDAAYTVGATTNREDDQLASFSSRGPVTVDGSGRLKPDISAPGVSIRSSRPGTGYGLSSGTSMAGPHVAGAVALLWSAVPGLPNDIPTTEAYLNDNALPIASTLCSSSGVPNNLYGWGRLNVYAAVQDALGDAGTLVGQVTSNLGSPIAGAQIWATRSPTLTTSLTSDAQGLYHGKLISDTYTVTVSSAGYLSHTVPGVAVRADLTTTLNVTLTAVYHPITGTVTAAGSGVPLGATVSVPGGVFPPTTSDPASGAYALSLPPGAYTLVAAASDYVSQSHHITVNGPLIQDFVLPPFPPVAGYVSSSPDLFGTTTIFTNTTAGIGPLSYAWLFGDGTPPSHTLTHLLTTTHTYSRPGLFTVWLTATNPGGSSVFTDTVWIHAHTFYLPLLLK